jgi:molybdopterin synthase catalytic subunit
MEKSWERLGQKEAAWLESLYQGIVMLIPIAKARNDISYTDFTREVSAIHFEPHSTMLNQLLDDISTHEAAPNRPMLSVLVRHKEGDHQPGPGFFVCAKRLKRQRLDEDDVAFWIRELSAAHDFWSAS